MKTKKTKSMEVTLNKEQGLYVIPCEAGYSCLGFDVCVERATALADEMGHTFKGERGTMEAYRDYMRLVDVARARNIACGWRSSSELTPQLIGLEGKRVEVIDSYGETRRFKVGKSTGFIPVHLEIERNADGGPAAMGAPYKSVTVIK